jgi:hypothetical protein
LKRWNLFKIPPQSTATAQSSSPARTKTWAHYARFGETLITPTRIGK